MNQPSCFFPEEPSRFSPESMDLLLAHCYRLKASDVNIQTGEPVMAEIHGRLRRITRRELSNTEVGDVLNGIYGANGTTQLLSGYDVDTHHEIRPNRNTRYRFRVNATACQVMGHHAIQMTLRTIPLEPPALDSLHLEPDILKALAPSEGVVYVTGATGSGKSTLLAAIVRSLAEDPAGHRKILTYEAPIEFVFDTIQKPHALVCQSEIPKHIGSFALGVRNALRRKPHTILVGEARDQETMAAVLEAALTGHPVYTTLHSTGVSETVRRLVSTFPREEQDGRVVDVVETLRLIVWQKLMQAPDGTRTAVREFLVFNETVRDELLRSNLHQVTQTTRKLLHEYGQPMLVDAERKFTEGRITERDMQVLRLNLERT